MRHREHTPGDCLCFVCFLHEKLLSEFELGLEFDLFPSGFFDLISLLVLDLDPLAMRKMFAIA